MSRYQSVWHFSDVSTVSLLRCPHWAGSHPPLPVKNRKWQVARRQITMGRLDRFALLSFQVVNVVDDFSQVTVI